MPAWDNSLPWALPVMGDGNWNMNQADKKPRADQSEQGFIPQFKAGLSTCDTLKLDCKSYS